MSPNESWAGVINELEELSNDDEFKLVRGALERLLNLANARVNGQEGQNVVTPDVILAELDRWKKVNLELKGDANPIETFSRNIPESAAGGRPAEAHAADKAEGDLYKAEGDVNKAEGDIFVNSSVYYMESYKDLKRELDRVPLEVVLFVMTQKEAEQLNSEEVFSRYNARYFRQFGEFQKKLTEEQVQDALERYGAAPEDWRPFKDSQDSIGKIVWDGLKMVRNYIKPIVPSFVDVRPLTGEESERANRVTLKLLRDEGCLVIIDVISMQHPAIQRAYRRALLDVYPHIPVITVAPTDRVLRFEQEMINFIERQPDLEVIKRVDWDGDDTCREVSRHSGLKNWITGQVPDILKRRDDTKRAQDNAMSCYKGVNGAA
jgi:hypothetical protein